jgi:hypothetical protein
MVCMVIKRYATLRFTCSTPAWRLSACIRCRLLGVHARVERLNPRCRFDRHLPWFSISPYFMASSARLYRLSSVRLAVSLTCLAAGTLLAARGGATVLRACIPPSTAPARISRSRLPAWLATSVCYLLPSNVQALSSSPAVRRLWHVLWAAYCGRRTVCNARCGYYLSVVALAFGITAGEWLSRETVWRPALGRTTCASLQDDGRATRAAFYSAAATC